MANSSSSSSSSSDYVRKMHFIAELYYDQDFTDFCCSIKSKDNNRNFKIGEKFVTDEGVDMEELDNVVFLLNNNDISLNNLQNKIYFIKILLDS